MDQNLNPAVQNPHPDVPAAPFVLTDEDWAAIQAEIRHYEDPRGASIEALKIVQRRQGWVSDEALAAVAQVLGVPLADLEGVATFYSLIFRKPVGRHVIKICDSAPCFLVGAESVSRAVSARLQIVPGQTTPDGRFTLLPICCLGACDRGPVLMINDDTHFHVEVAHLDALLERYP
jgi:NADH-quinone oxidoreductase subunit E